MTLGIDKMVLEYVGLGLTVVLATSGFMKWLRDDGILRVLLIITSAIAVFGLIVRSDELKMVNGNAADVLLGPLVYIGSYTLLRRAYLKKHSIEPTYERHQWYDAEEGRRQNWFDVAVHILPLMLALVVPVVIGEVFP